MKDKVVAVVGGAGFVGRNVVRELCKKGVRVTLAAAIPSRQVLRSMGDVGQVNLIKVNVANYDQMARLIEGADHVISLVGICMRRKVIHSKRFKLKARCLSEK